MDYRQALLVLLSVLLCSSQGLTESSTEATLVHRPSGTSTEAIPKSTPQDNVSDLLKMMNKLNHPIFELTKTVIRLDEMNSRIMTRLDEMNSESVKRFDEINSTMMTRLDKMNGETVKRFEENNSTMFSLFDKLDKKTQKNSDESLKKSEEMDNKLMKRLDEMNSETVKHFDETDLHVKSLDISITNSSEINLNKYLTLSQDMKKFSTRLDEIEARLQSQAGAAPDSQKNSRPLPTKQEVSSYGKQKQFVLFTDEKKTWQGAYDDCIKRNMMLASIQSGEENNKVVSLFKTRDRGNDFWLSGTDLGIENCVYVSRGGNMLLYGYECSDLSTAHYICQHWV